MTNQSRLIIKGYDGTTVLYRGDGKIDQWKEKLGGEEKLTEQVYYVMQVERHSGATQHLSFINDGFMRLPTDGNYVSLGRLSALFPLDRESRNLLLELLNDSTSDERR